MTCHVRWLPLLLAGALAIFVATTAAPTATAQQITITEGGSATADDPDAYARRLEQVLDSLELLIADDQQAAATGTPISEAKANALRRAVQRLVLSARNDGRNIDFVAARLQEAARERFGDDIPGAFADTNGDLDARALIRGTIGKTRVSRSVERDTSYLSAISEEGSRTTVGGGRSTPDAEAVQTADTESADALETSEERDVRLATQKRLQIVGQQRFITVQAGDTLGSLARDIYGDMLLFRRIYSANRGVISNPNVITPGTRLVIP